MNEWTRKKLQFKYKQKTREEYSYELFSLSFSPLRLVWMFRWEFIRWKKSYDNDTENPVYESIHGTKLWIE